VAVDQNWCCFDCTEKHKRRGAGGKSYEALKATTYDLEILLYLDSSHKLIRLEVPSAKVAVVRE